MAEVDCPNRSEYVEELCVADERPPGHVEESGQRVS